MLVSITDAVPSVIESPKATTAPVWADAMTSIRDRKNEVALTDPS